MSLFSIITIVIEMLLVFFPNIRIYHSFILRIMIEW